MNGLLIGVLLISSMAMVLAFSIISEYPTSATGDPRITKIVSISSVITLLLLVILLSQK